MSILGTIVIIYHNRKKSETHPQRQYIGFENLIENLPMFFLPYPKVDDTNFSISFYKIKASGRSLDLPIYIAELWGRILKQPTQGTNITF